jgi:bifunctional DNA-binding transcriptional regulator/antitoxin component of YhaV-PrlF toxin-antitoxin module
LTIAIRDLETDEDDEEVEYVIKRLYEFFILGARKNFKTVISLDILSHMQKEYENDQVFFQEINDQIDNYSPLVTVLTPNQFIQYCGDKEVLEIFENNKASGNFLRKYSPKLYQNDDFLVEIINRITMLHQFKQDMIEVDHNNPAEELILNKLKENENG